jgi:hypothetical protein
MVVATLIIAAIAASSAKAGTALVSSVLDALDRAEVESRHEWFGHTFVCKNNLDYTHFLRCQESIHVLATYIGDVLRASPDDVPVLAKYILQGVLSWGRAGGGIAAPLSEVLNGRDDVLPALQAAMSGLMPDQRSDLQMLHELVLAETGKTS